MRNRRTRQARAGATCPRTPVAIALAAALTGCAGDPGATTATTLTVRAQAERGRVVATVSGLRPADRVERFRLVGPDGTRLRPEDRRHSRSVRTTSGQPTVGVQARGGSASGIEPGLTLSLDLFDWVWGGSNTVDQRSVSAVFAVPPGGTSGLADWNVEAVIIDPAGHARTRRAPVTAR